MIQNGPNCTYIEEKHEISVHDMRALYDTAYRDGFEDGLKQRRTKEDRFELIITERPAPKAP